MCRKRIYKEIHKIPLLTINDSLYIHLQNFGVRAFYFEMPTLNLDDLYILSETLKQRFFFMNIKKISYTLLNLFC